MLTSPGLNQGYGYNLLNLINPMLTLSLLNLFTQLLRCDFEVLQAPRRAVERHGGAPFDGQRNLEIRAGAGRVAAWWCDGMSQGDS